MGNAVGNIVVAPIYCALKKAVRIVYPSGKVLLHTKPISVADLLQEYPHHYISEAGRERQFPKNSMLPPEAELRPGRTYFLLPLPRLFSVQTVRRRRSYPACCFSLATDGFSDSDSSDDTERQSSGQSLGSLLAMDSCFTGLFTSLSYYQLKRSHVKTTPMTPELQKIIKNAEEMWKQMNEMAKELAWRPELESIKEEQTPLRQTLASLMRANSVGPSPDCPPPWYTQFKNQV